MTNPVPPAGSRRPRLLGAFGAVTALAVAGGLWLALAAPPDAFQGNFVRIMYVHVPAAWLAFLAFGVTALGSVGWLLRRTDRWDRLAAASAELGVVFTAVALVTGSLWGRPVWGTYWDWGDARMASTALILFVYLGYLALRRATLDPVARARRSAILGAVAVVQVPLVYFSVTLWRTLHQPMSVRPDGVTMEPAMLAALLGNLAVFTLAYGVLLAARMRLAALDAAAEAPDEPVAGSTVVRPVLGGER